MSVSTAESPLPVVLVCLGLMRAIHCFVASGRSYPFWYPWLEGDQDSAFRFRFAFRSG